MKREILCLPCQRSLLGKINGDPGERHKWVRGLLTRHCMCDACGAGLKPDDKAVALSIWADRGGVSYYPWEHEFFALGTALVVP